MTSLAAAVGSCALLSACGGASGSTTAGSGSQPTLSEAKVNAIAKADVEIFSSANATGYLTPHAVKRDRELLKPLIVARTLKVKPSNQVAGGLVESLTNQLTPGFTAGSGSNEHLKAGVVHRFLAFGRRDPTKVFRPSAAHGVSRLIQLLRGQPSDTLVTGAGVTPPQTARGIVTHDVETIRRYWPDLAHRLETLNRSFRWARSVRPGPSPPAVRPWSRWPGNGHPTRIAGLHLRPPLVGDAAS